ncbi:iron-sulfur cluster repair di-iron protein [Desulfosporosinus acidiphilus SJ4]|uniref:Iron-sulfur cluster repair di-iron protein n=1 Tax=Desulfosporosinus acidiphilus (strain DSM 22704 / JCM 16185 / SJ4) TaxID=646529 RepID=I4D729_DESAJ|nr:iron-sulfur cluster repair di-iron protein [Desulfosporosinus acidiphilus]AFM41603.1 iron-sulfur cluster repair di-iron protein [Desulfosporosinus acidiphilus SJ4]
MTQFQANQKIGTIVSAFPGAADLFKKYKIDFCCGGDRLLLQAIQDQNLNEIEILSQLNQMYEEARNKETVIKDWTREPSEDLIDHIVNTHHAYLQLELPKISELTTKILRVHGVNHPELVKVHKLFHELKTELDQHLIKEEVIEFPLIKEYVRTTNPETLTKVMEAIGELETEHEGAGRILKELRKITNDYHVPDDACNSFGLTYHKFQDLESDIFQHIHLENNILFPRLARK